MEKEPHPEEPALRASRRTRGADPMDAQMRSVELNGREYRLPERPVVVICADGFDPAYLDAGLDAGVLPTMAAWRQHGFCTIADAAMPTFTNPNNMSIVTGDRAEPKIGRAHV